MGQHHVRVVAQSNRFELVAIANNHIEHAQEIADRYHCPVFKSVDDLLSCHEIDAASVCVPTNLHHKIVVKLLKKGIHTLVEKPIASSVHEAEEMLAVADAAAATLLVGHIERFNPAIQKIKSLIKEDQLGEIRSIIARRVGSIPPQIKDTDIAVDLAIHDIDVINCILAEEPEYIAVNKQKSILNDRYDSVEIFFKFPQCSAFIQANWLTPVQTRKLYITGSKGLAEIDYKAQKIDTFLVPGSGLQKDYEHHCIDFEYKEPIVAELEYFADMIAAGERIDCRFAVKALEIALRD